jgi:hypothetical protein
MPEIKNMFQKGIMNKDLDERLVPNGQYRDAMNVQVSTSESSEVGTVQNILGNTRVEDIIGEQFKCVGAITDEKNNVLYWFVTSLDVDAIIEYRDDSINQSTNTCTPILVDKKVGTSEAVLKFDPNNIITGINIIDNLLFWTDDVNEPKKINIDTFKLNPNNGLGSHSDMYVNGISVGDVTEDHITVIRKRPQKAPTVVFSETSVSTINILPKLNFFEAIVGSTINYSFDFTDQDFLDAYNLVDNTGQQLPNFYYTTGKEFILSLESDVNSLPYNHKVKLEVISSGPTPPIPNGWNGATEMMTTNLVFKVKEISESYTDEELTFNTTLVDEDKTIFEKEFIRFATRYKYEDGEYSAYSPFTTPIFLPGSFYFHPTDDPYNQGMESNAINITLQDLIPYDIPDDVIQLDILFKKERSTTIYSIDSIKPDDIAPADHWLKDDFANKVILNTDFVDGDTTNTSHVSFPYSSSGEYTITTENIYAALPENQMLRPWDNVPRKALAQEITANRVVYGNYLQNYNLKDYLGETASPWIITGKESRQVLNNPVSFSNNVGKKSVKSLRTYYLGVVYGDKYGRETPVFTSKDASIHVPYDLDPSITFDGAANKSLRLTAKLLGNQPEWAYYYKYYIKQTTDEYYNLTMDRVYRGDEDVNLWISFPSSDRNKIQEGDYFSIKKQVDLNSIVEVENKIKIIDIKNEAPDTIKYNFMSLGNGGGSAADLSALFPDVNQHPRPGTMKLLIDREAWMDDENGLDFEDAAAKSDKIAVQFSVTSGGAQQVSKRYIASAWAFDEDTGNDGRWSIQLRNPISQEDYWTEQAPGVLNSDQAFSITIMWMVEKPATEFEGRFFVKVISNAVTQQYLVPSTSDSTNFATVGVIPAVFNLANTPGIMIPGGGTTGIYNTENTSFGTTTTNDSLSDTVSDWVNNTNNYDSTVFNQDNQGWFIDATHFIAAQDQNGGMNANHSGKMYLGNPSISTQYVNGLEGIVSFPGGLAGTEYHPNSSRQWSSAVIPLAGGISGGGAGPVPIFSSGQFNNDGSYLTNYATPTFMHLSFSSPGVDLQDYSGFNDIEDWLGDVNAFNPLLSGTWITQAELLTAIFSLGAFGKIKGTTIMQRGVNGGYDQWMVWWEALSAAVVSWDDDWFYPSIGSNSTYWNALSSSDKDDCLKAFDVTYNNPSNASIVSNLVAGSKFMVNNDDQNVYTILDVSVQHLYNHTSWNPIIRRYSNGSLMDMHQTPECVASRLQHFVNEFRSDQAWSLYSTEWDQLKEAIINFGKANNRRTCYILTLDKDPRQGSENLLDATASTHKTIKFIENYIEPGANTLPTSPAIFETEAKESLDLNIYYEASNALPVGLDDDVSSLKGHLLGPIGSKVTCSLANSLVDYDIQNYAFPNNDFHLRVSDWEGRIVSLNNPGLKTNPAGQVTATSNDQTGWDAQTAIYEGKSLRFWREDGSYTTAQINEVVEISNSGNYITKVLLSPKNYKHKVGLPYYNCFSFGNGVESNRIRDDFNESFILNGVRASTVLEEPYEEERRKYGLIYSGVYNSISGVNNLNQFIQAEKITKDLMPSYGSIQKLYARDKDLITLCEDKIIRVYVDKDILYNADGNTQLLATNRVLGAAEPFRGNFGISKNPESFAAESFRAYFTDKQRGAVIRLSMDGLTPISDAGMHDFFRDNLRDGGRLYGSYDAHKEDYNLSIYFEDGINQVCNPGFEEGLSTDIQLLSSFVLNYSFTSSAGWSYGQIFNGGFDVDPNTMSDGWGNDAASGGVSWSDGSLNI